MENGEHLRVSRWKSASVFLAVYAVFSSLTTVVVACYSVFAPFQLIFPGSLSISLVCNLVCLCFVLAVWYPATHAVRAFLEEKFLAQTWYVFWVLPVLFIFLNLSMQHARYDSLKSAIEEIRQARHDLRHHFAVLRELARREDWFSLSTYLDCNHLVYLTSLFTILSPQHTSFLRFWISAFSKSNSAFFFSMPPA